MDIRFGIWVDLRKGGVDIEDGVWGEVADKGRSRRGREGGQETISS